MDIEIRKSLQSSPMNIESIESSLKRKREKINEGISTLFHVKFFTDDDMNMIFFEDVNNYEEIESWKLLASSTQTPLKNISNNSSECDIFSIPLYPLKLGSFGFSELDFRKNYEDTIVFEVLIICILFSFY
jgi:hypothetical protein